MPASPAIVAAYLSSLATAGTERVTLVADVQRRLHSLPLSADAIADADTVRTHLDFISEIVSVTP